MEEWSKQFWQSIEAVAYEASRFLEAVAQQATESAAELSVAFSDQAEQVGQAIAPDLDSLVLRLEQIIGSETEPTPELEAMAEQIGVTLEPLLASVLIDFSTWAEQVSNPMSQTMDPFFQQHAACVGCRNYHGQVYNGNLLVCGLYPYGPNQEKCPDWESAWSA